MASDKKHALGTVTDEIVTTIDGKGRNEGGGHDNLTLAIIETKTNSKLRSKMNKKTKLLLGAVSLICLLSLVFNGVLLGRNNSSASEEDNSTLNDSINTLNKAIAKQDTVINKLHEDNNIQYNDIQSFWKELDHAVRNDYPAKRISTKNIKTKKASE